MASAGFGAIKATFVTDATWMDLDPPNRARMKIHGTAPGSSVDDRPTRLPISATENVVSNAERRAIQTGERDIVPRIADIYAALPAITGKIELEYEGELVGGHTIAKELIRRAADATYQDRAGGINTDEIIMWFDVGGALQITDDVPVDAVVEGFGSVPGLMQVVNTAGLAPMDDLPVVAAGCELVLESLVARKKIARSDAGQYGRAVEEKRRRPYQD